MQNKSLIFFFTERFDVVAGVHCVRQRESGTSSSSSLSSLSSSMSMLDCRLCVIVETIVQVLNVVGVVDDVVVVWQDFDVGAMRQLATLLVRLQTH